MRILKTMNNATLRTTYVSRPRYPHLDGDVTESPQGDNGYHTVEHLRRSWRTRQENGANVRLENIPHGIRKTEVASGEIVELTLVNT